MRVSSLFMRVRAVVTRKAMRSVRSGHMLDNKWDTLIFGVCGTGPGPGSAGLPEGVCQKMSVDD